MLVAGLKNTSDDHIEGQVLRLVLNLLNLKYHWECHWINGSEAYSKGLSQKNKFIITWRPCGSRYKRKITEAKIKPSKTTTLDGWTEPLKVTEKE